MKDALLTLALGLAMGVTLSRIGFSSWDEVHAMFTFASLRMFLAFCGAVAVLAIAWPLIARAFPTRTQFRRRPIHPGTLAGGVIFGAGWALSGACPSIAMVQLGEGQLAAGWTLLGIFAGNWLYSAVHVRFFKWDAGSCLDD
ncbi:MAG: YeeE/YedE thiosulfate transporter family protein [Myxococcales bacterium]|nr:YeeE/YedE thiosulfate transporter family protein [Myxococcales bacterium]